jgi:hypothetical protein
VNASLVGANKVNGQVPTRAGRRPASFTKFYRMLKFVLTRKMSAIFLVSGVGGACMGSTGIDASTGVLIGLTVGSNVGFVVSRASVGGTGIGGRGNRHWWSLALLVAMASGGHL